MARTAIVNLSVQDKGVQAKLNQTQRKFRSFNAKLRADQKRNAAAVANVQKSIAGLGTAATAASPELARLTLQLQAASGALGGLTSSRSLSGLSALNKGLLGLGVFAPAILPVVNLSKKLPNRLSKVPLNTSNF